MPFMICLPVLVELFAIEDRVCPLTAVCRAKAYPGAVSSGQSAVGKIEADFSTTTALFIKFLIHQSTEDIAATL
jgi:nucleoside diphosphate kinase